MNLEQARFNMIEQQIRPWEVLDQNVLSLLAAVRREEFVPPAYRSLAFVDTEVPLPEGQCMLAPKVEARLLQELHLARHERSFRTRGHRLVERHMVRDHQRSLPDPFPPPLVVVDRGAGADPAGWHTPASG